MMIVLYSVKFKFFCGFLKSGWLNTCCSTNHLESDLGPIVVTVCGYVVEQNHTHSTFKIL